MMQNHANLAWLVLPAAALLGPLGAALACTYARAIADGAMVDGSTLQAAGRAVLLQKDSARVSVPLALLCAVLLGLAGVPFVMQPSVTEAARFGVCVVLLVLALIDIFCGLLPDALTLPLMWAGLLAAWAGIGVSLHEAVPAAAGGYLLLWAADRAFLFFRGRAGMGHGDMKLLAAIGAWLGWAALPGVLFTACVAGMVFAFLWRGKTAWQGSLAFGPFLALAGAVGLLGGPVVQFIF